MSDWVAINNLNTLGKKTHKFLTNFVKIFIYAAKNQLT